MTERPTGDQVPALRESEAEGEAAAIFAEIRTALGTSSVNLVWRHLAVIPGALPWVWGAIAPLHRSGAADDAGALLRERLALPGLPALPAEAQRLLGLSGEDMAAIESMLRGYFLSCTVNVATLGAVLLRLDGAAPAGLLERSIVPTVAPTGIARMAPLVDPGAMPADLAALAWRLNALGERGDGRILASLYRYAANWPGFMALLWALLAPMAADGRLDRLIDRTLAEAEPLSRALLAGLGQGPAPFDADRRAQVRAALVGFGREAIAKMIPIAGMLHAMVVRSATP